MDRKLRVKAIIDRNIRDILLTNMVDKIGFFSINKIEISNDYSYADVYISFFDDKNAKKYFEKLKKSVPFFRHQLSQKLSIYKTPNIRLVFDDRFLVDQQMNELLKEDAKKLKAIQKQKKK